MVSNSKAGIGDAQTASVGEVAQSRVASAPGPVHFHRIRVRRRKNTA
jgi:hypothetical protein